MNWASIPINEIIRNDYRLEAGCYNIDAIRAIELINKLDLDTKNLCGDEGLAHAHYPSRFKRIYVDKSSFPLVLPSQITDTRIKPVNYMSRKTLRSFESLRITDNELLLTRSGTIGKVRYTTNSLKDLYLSDDLIRLKTNDPVDSAYIYAFIRTNIGQILLSAKPYGAVIKHIEPEHLHNYKVPYPDEETRSNIGEKVIRSFELRDRSNSLVEAAEGMLISELNLPPLSEVEIKRFKADCVLKNFCISLDELQERFEAKYHDPIIDSIISMLLKSKSIIMPLGDQHLSKKITMPGRFKRIFVEKNNGTVFLGGKQIYELDPYNKKYLSVKKHGDRIANQLFLHENMIAITRSGTIGRVNLVPKYMENWIYSEHIIRVIPSSNDIAGYIYIWLSTEYGRIMIERFSYGAVIKEIDVKQVSDILIPIIHDKHKMKQINELALESNRLRSEAYYLEQEAIDDVNKLIGFDNMEE